jgi:trafficking protein particle complex subunit 1
MVCFTLYVFDRTGSCLAYREWLRPKPVSRGAGTDADDRRQMFALLWTLSNACAALDPTASPRPPLGAPRRLGSGSALHSFTASGTYKLHYLEAATGLRLALSTSPEAGDLGEAMEGLYAEVVAPFAARNPLGARGAAEAAEEAERAATAAAAAGNKKRPPVVEANGAGGPGDGALATEPFFEAVDAFLRARGLLQQL